MFTRRGRYRVYIYILCIHIYIYIQSGARNVIPLIVHVTHFYYYKKHLTSGTELILIGWKIVPNEEHVQCDHRFASQPLANEPLYSSQLFDTYLQKARGTTSFTMWAQSCATFSGPHSEVVPRAF